MRPPGETIDPTGIVQSRTRITSGWNGADAVAVNLEDVRKFASVGNYGGFAPDYRFSDIRGATGQTDPQLSFAADPRVIRLAKEAAHTRICPFSRRS